MVPESERNERTAVAATGVSAAQADLSAPMTDQRSQPDSSSRGAQDASRPAPTEKSEATDQPAPTKSEAEAFSSETHSAATPAAAVSGSSQTAIEANQPTEGGREQESAALRPDTRAETRVDGVSREDGGSPGSSTSIELHNEIVLTADGGPEGATPSPGSAWDEMHDRMDALTSDQTSVTGRVTDQMDDMRDRLDDFADGGIRTSADGGFDALRERADDILGRATASEDRINLEGGLDEVRQRLDDFAEDGIGRSNGIDEPFQAIRDSLETLRIDPLTDKEEDVETSDTRNEGGLAALIGRPNDAPAGDAPGERGDVGQAQIYGPEPTDPGVQNATPGFLAALFDGDRAPTMDWGAPGEAGRSDGSDGYLDPGEARDMNLTDASAIMDAAQGFAFDPMDLHA